MLANATSSATPVSATASSSSSLLPLACGRHLNHGESTAQIRGTRGARGGSWTWCTHVSLYGLNFDFGMGNFLLSLAPRNSLEFGCGLGLYSSYLHKMAGTKAIGIEPQAMPNSIFSGTPTGWPKQLADDFTSNGTTACREALGKFDLVFSLEVAEHIPRERHDRVLDLLAQHAGGFLVFGAARLGQVGHGHISLRSPGAWTAELTKRGFTLLPKTTKALKNEAVNRNYRANTRVYAAPGAPLGMALDGPEDKRPKRLQVPSEHAHLLSRTHYGKRVPLNHSDGHTVEVQGQRVPWVSWKTFGLRQGEAHLWPGLVREQGARCVKKKKSKQGTGKK